MFFLFSCCKGKAKIASLQKSGTDDPFVWLLTQIWDKAPVSGTKSILRTCWLQLSITVSVSVSVSIRICTYPSKKTKIVATSACSHVLWFLRVVIGGEFYPIYNINIIIYIINMYSRYPKNTERRVINGEFVETASIIVLWTLVSIKVSKTSIHIEVFTYQ